MVEPGPGYVPTMKRPEMIDDLKGVPDVARDAVRDTDQAMTNKVEESRTTANFLDFRTLLVAAGIALVVAALLRILFLAALPSAAVFVALFIAVWAILASQRHPPFAGTEEKERLRRHEGGGESEAERTA